jgi:hypothetical protein
LALRDREWLLNDGQIQNPSAQSYIAARSQMGWWGFGFVHHSRTVFCRAVPNPNLTIRHFFIAVRRAANCWSGRRSSPRCSWSGRTRRTSWGLRSKRPRRPRSIWRGNKGAHTAPLAILGLTIRNFFPSLHTVVLTLFAAARAGEGHYRIGK